MMFSNKQKKIIILAVTAVVIGILYTLYDAFLFSWYKQVGEIHVAAAPRTDGYQSTFWQGLRELYDGYWRVADVSVYEYRMGPTTLHPLLNQYLYFPLLLIAGLYGVVPLGNFVFAIAAFLLLYKLAMLLTERFSLSVAFAAFFTLVRDWPYLLFSKSINGFKDLIKTLLPYTAPGSPANRLNFMDMESYKPGFVIFGPFLIFLFLFLKTEKRKYALLAGVFYGLLFYTYTFFWIYATITLGLAGLLWLLLKKYKLFFMTALAGLIGAVISSYFWMTYFAAKKFAQFSDYVARNGGVELTHQFRWSQWFWYVVFFAATILIYKFYSARGRLYVGYFMGILFLSGFIAFNMQVITGMNIQPDHWHLRVMILPLALMWLLFGEWIFLKLEKRHYQKYAVIFLIFVTISNFSGSAQAAYNYAKQKFETFRLPPGIMQSMQWMDKNLPKDAVVVTPIPYINDLLLYYTPAKVFFPQAPATWAGETEMQERLFDTYKLFGVEEIYLRRALTLEEKDTMYRGPKEPTDMSIFEYLYFQQFYNTTLDAYITGQDLEQVPEGKIERLITDFKNYHFSLGDLGDNARADYVYVGPFEQRISTFNFDRSSMFQKIYDREGVRIYKITPAL